MWGVGRFFVSPILLRLYSAVPRLFDTGSLPTGTGVFDLIGIERKSARSTEIKLSALNSQFTLGTKGRPAVLGRQLVD